MPARSPCRTGGFLWAKSSVASAPVLLRTLPSNDDTRHRNPHARRGPVLMRPGPPAREEGVLSRQVCPVAGTALTPLSPGPPVSRSRVFWQLVTEARRYRALR